MVVAECQTSSTREVAQKYKIPESTLRGWIKRVEKGGTLLKGNQRQGKPGRKPILPKVAETAIKKWILDERSKGAPITTRVVKEYVGENYANDNFQASRGWLTKFMVRKNLTVRVAGGTKNRTEMNREANRVPNPSKKHLEYG
uniref:HTH CENPB-type domain-containing protein n=1 Tax=Arcella intermedia TaxID=1963864 RepID=A0A6B2LPD8_9EUKA